MITKYRFGTISAPVEVVDSAGVIVPDAGIEFVLTAGNNGLTITHIHFKAVRSNAIQSVGPIVTLPGEVN